MASPNAEKPALEGERASGNSLDQGKFFSFRAQRLFQNLKGSCFPIAVRNEHVNCTTAIRIFLACFCPFRSLRYNILVTPLILVHVVIY
jgi:hypothetical protein